MHLLIDENVPESVTEFFRARGHEVSLVRDILLPGTPDPVVGAVGDEMAAIVVSWDRDFRSIASRLPGVGKRRLRRLGRISFRCSEPHGRQLIEKWIEHVEFEYAQAQKRGDKRLMVEIMESGLKVIA